MEEQKEYLIVLNDSEEVQEVTITRQEDICLFIDKLIAWIGKQNLNDQVSDIHQYQHAGMIIIKATPTVAHYMQVLPGIAAIIGPEIPQGGYFKLLNTS